MLGTIGFLAGALTISSFAATSQRAYTAVNPRRLQLFGFAFGTLALAMLLWASVAMTGEGNPTGTQHMLLAGEILLMAGTAAMTLALFRRTSLLVSLGLTFITAFLIIERAFVYPPTGFVREGLIHFNLAGNTRLVIISVFLIIWLPAVIKIAREASLDRAFFGLENALPASFVVLALTTALFLSARRPAMIIAQFIIMISIFLVMTIINLAVIRLHKHAPSIDRKPVPVKPVTKTTSAKTSKARKAAV